MTDRALKITTQKQAVRQSYDRLVANRKKGFGLGGVSTGIDAINLSIGGFLPEKVTIFAARSGIGKGQTLDSKIYTPDGYKLMGDIKIGDSVLNEDGGSSIVLGVYPQGLRKTYLFSLNDGSTIKADENHLWKIYTAKDRKSVCDSKSYKTTIISPDRHSILSTKDMIGKEHVYMCKGRENLANLKLPTTKAAQHTKKDLLIKPYALGALIGDGCFSRTSFSNNDREVVNRTLVELGKEPDFRNSGGQDCCYSLARIDIRGQLKELFGDEFKKIKSIHKYIPQQYLYSTIKDRIDLLNGLLDTDGYASKNGRSVEFYTSSKQLALDVKQLVESLGGTGKITNRGKKFYRMLDGSKKQSVNDSYAVGVNLPNNTSPFYLPRKADKVKPKEKYETPRYITKIEYVGEEETQCIKVDNPTSLYLTDHYTVTHNTGLINSFISGGNPVRQGTRGAFLVCSWEMSPSLLVTREICRRQKMTQGLFLNGASLIGEETMKEITDIYSECATYDVQYQTVSTNLTNVKKLAYSFLNKCKENEQKEGVKIQPIVIIDYIQMMKDESGGLKTYQLSDFMVGIKDMANETGVHFAVLAQLQREVDSTGEPERYNLSDSKSIEDNCDSMCFLHRPEYNGNEYIRDPKTGEDVLAEKKMMIRTLKDRNFGTRDTLINCDIRYFRFWGLEDEYEDDFHQKYTSKKFWMNYFNFDKTDDKQQDLELYKNK